MSDYAKARHNMVESQVRCVGVTDPAITSAMSVLPREKFVAPEKRGVAYMDEDVQIGEDPEGRQRFMLEPRAFSLLVELADIGQNDLVLDIGCGTGYSAAVLSRMAGAVIALESAPDLAARATQLLSDLDCDNAAVVEGPLEHGYPQQGPFDVILLNGGIEEVPQALFDQLKEGGRLVAVMTSGISGHGTLYLKAEGVVSSAARFDAVVQPLPGFAKETTFTF